MRLKRFRSCILFILFFAESGFAQTTVFENIDYHSPYYLSTDSVYLNFIYKTDDSKPRSLFHFITLNEDNSIKDSVSYTFQGKLKLIAAGFNGKYKYHAFFDNTNQSILFLITDRFGKKISLYLKKEDAFTSLFSRNIGNLSNIDLSFVEDINNPEIIFVQPILNKGKLTFQGKVFAMSVTTGNKIWDLEIFSGVSQIEASNDRILVISYELSFMLKPIYSINLYNKSDGNKIKSFKFFEGDGFRFITGVKTNGIEFFLTGTQQPRKSKERYLFATLFDHEGKAIFDRVDTTARMSNQRFHPLITIFDRDGNLVVIGETYHFLDVTEAAAGTGISVLSAITLGTTPYLNSNLHNRIESLVSVKLSPADGSVLEFINFPNQPRYDNFTRTISNGKQVMLLLGGEAWIYDINNMASPPELFKFASKGESILLSSSGPIDVQRDVKMKRIFFTRY